MTHDGSHYSIVGVAWGAPIASVEVSIDGGPWQPTMSCVALGHVYANRANAALECALEALGVASSLGDVDAIVLARNAAAAALASLDPRGTSALEYALTTVAMCGPKVSPEHTLIAYNGLTNSLAGVGRYAEIIDVAAAGVDLVRSSGLGGPLGTAMASYWVGCLVTLGRWSEAEVVSDDLADLLDHPAERDLSLYLETALIRQGRLDEVRETMERVRALFGEPDFWLETLCELGGVLIEFDAAGVQHPDPAPFVDDLLDRCRDRVSCGHWQLVAAAIAAVTDRLPATSHRLANDTTTAVILVNRWIDHVDSVVETAAPEDCLHRSRAVAELSRLRGRPDAAAWAHVASGFEELGMSYDEAYARWRWEEALLAGVAGRTKTARCEAAEVLRRARALAADLPAPPLLGEIDSLAACARLNLDQFGAAPRPVSTVDGCIGADAARARCSRTRRLRSFERSHRRAAVHLSQDGERSCLQHPAQVVPRQPRRGRRRPPSTQGNTCLMSAENVRR